MDPARLARGELGLLVAALALAAGSVATVDFFADRVQRALTGSAADLLAADAAIEWSEAPRAEWEEAARAAGLRTARTLSFPSVVLHGDATQLVQIKAIGDGYPLRGRLRGAPIRRRSRRPKSGWSPPARPGARPGCSRSSPWPPAPSSRLASCVCPSPAWSRRSLTGAVTCSSLPRDC